MTYIALGGALSLAVAGVGAVVTTYLNERFRI
jgi:hypothetical protein